MKLIYVQYPVATVVFVVLIYAAFFGLFRGFMRRKEPRQVLELLVGLNILRFGGAAAALAAAGKSEAPTFLLQVAVGDGLTAVLAVIALALLWRRSERALMLTTIMNVVGLLDILISEAWIGYLQRIGAITGGPIHGPSIGAAFYTALHIFIFYFISHPRISTSPTTAVPAPGR